MKEIFSGEALHQEPDAREEVEKLVAEEKHLLEKQSAFFEGVDAAQICDDFYEIPEAIIKDCFDAMMARVDQETGVVAEIYDTIGRDNLLGNLAEGSFGFEVSFDKKAELNVREGSGLEREGSFDSRTGRIKIGDRAPDAATSWIHLAVGAPKVWESLDHELTHAWFSEYAKKVPEAMIEYFKDFLKQKFWYGIALWVTRAAGRVEQFSEKQSRFEKFAQKCDDLVEDFIDQFEKSNQDRIQAVRRKNLLSEIVAQKAGRAFSGSKNNTVALADVLMEDYGYREPTHVDMMIVASQIIDRLRVLGYDDRVIAAKLAQAQYDAVSASFPELEKEIESTAEQQGMDLMDVDTAADVMRLEKRVDMRRATVIAQEELKKMVG